MARTPCTFRQNDVTRALRATVAAGIGVRRVEIDKDGKIIVFAWPPDAAAAEKTAEDAKQNDFGG